MAVPAGAEVDSVFIRTTEGEVYSLGSSNKDPMTASTYRYIKNANFKRDAYRDDMILTGVFSVQNGGGQPVKQVFFSKGNLWADVSGLSPSFYFESNQFDYQTSYSQNHLNHFYFTNDASKAHNSTSSDMYSVLFTNATDNTAKADFTVDGQTGKYRTLSGDEWEYLLKTRTVIGSTGEDHSYQRATINSDATGVYGMILYPDNYSEKVKESYTSAEWTAMETAGCVFLPAAGYRKNSSLSEVGSPAYYWSPNPTGFSQGKYMSFNGSSVVSYGKSSCDRDTGCSVRLVSECK